MDILSQQLAGHIPDVPTIRTKLSDPFPVALWVERLTGNQKVKGSTPVRDSEVFSSEKKKLVLTNISCMREYNIANFQIFRFNV